MSRTVTRKFCDRTKVAHVLATVHTGDQGRVVEVREVVATRRRLLEHLENTP